MNELIFISTNSKAIVFSAMGFKVHILKAEEIINFLGHLDKNIKLIGYDQSVRDSVNVYKKNKQNVFPLLLELPLEEENIGNKLFEVKESIKKSIGIDLL